MRTLCLAALITVLFSSCWGFNTREAPYIPATKHWAWVPVYSLDTSYRAVSYKPAQPVEHAGKIYVKDNFIYQCETGSGIHVIDNTDPKTSHRVGFIEVKGCEEISIKDNFLYTNNYYDLVTIDIGTPQQARVVSRVRNAFYSSTSAQYHTWEMPKDKGWFVCPQLYTDSVIVNWVRDSAYANCNNF